MLEDVYPLSPLQEGLYYHWLSAPASQAYVEQTSYQVKGHFDIAILEKSYQALVARHAILRTFFTQEIGDRPLQVVKKSVDSGFRYLDFSGNIADFKAADRLKGFDLHTGSQMRLTVLGLGQDTYEFIWSFHHILMDGWCGSILINEFFRFYTAMTKRKMPVLPRVYPYSGYISWLSKIDKEKTIAYWRDHLSGYDTVNTLPKVAGNGNKEYCKQERRIEFKGAVRQSIAGLCNAAGITENTFIQTAWGILLGRYNNTSDVVFGAVVSGRPAELEGIESMIGLFINTIPVRIQYNPETTVRELLKSVHRAAVEGLQHHYVQLAEIQSETAAGRNLFDHILAFENFPVLERVEKSIAQEENKTQTTLLSASVFELSNYDFTINASAGETFTIKFNYNANCFEETRINQLQQHLVRLIENLVQAPDSLVHEIDYLGAEEKLQLQAAMNNSVVDYPKNKTIVSLFEEQVEKTPDNIALVFENARFTYRELNGKANQLGAYLRQQYNIGPDDLAGIKLERSEWMVIAILGVLKSGAAYMPVDPQYPQERIDFMLTDSSCKVLIDDKELHTFMQVAESYNSANPALINKPADLAYVIYTSGTTGKPKGALIEHRNVVRLMKNDKTLFDFSSDDTWTMFHSFCFDFSVWEMYGALLFGGKLIVIPALTAKDPVAYLDILSREKVTVLNQTPSSFYNLIKQDASLQLRYVIFGGEALSPGKLKEWNARYPDTKLINMYGITETTVHVTYKEITATEIENNISNIGKPIPTLSCYVLDQQQHLVPVGIPGELYVGGEGVARGYLNRPELTSQRFIANPFAEGTLLYRSGDSVRLLPNGELEYIGRIDNQVKIRGHRIELGEIENALLNTAKIEIAVVIAQKNEKNEHHLVAYVVSKEPLNTLELRLAISKKLPSYMLPGHFVQLETLPLTSNGKVDKKRLPAPEGLELNTGVTYVAPGNEIEQQLVAVFEEVLKKQPVGIKDDFFILGGDSIKSIQIVSRLKQRGYKLTIQDVMLHPVIAALAEHVSLVSRTADQGLAEGFIPMTPIQTAFFQSSMINKHHFNQSVLLYSKAQLSAAGLTAALDMLILHHDALRMVYREGDAGWIQENGGADHGYSFEVIEEADHVQFAAHCERIQSTINLTTGPLFKAALFPGKSGDRLLLVAHHLVVDAVSWRIIFEDLSDLYQQYLMSQPLSLPLKTDSFKYWQEKQAAYALSETLEGEDKYWSAIESLIIDSLPMDHPDGGSLMKDAATCTFSLDEGTTGRLLTECYKTHQTEINDILLTGLSLALNDVFHIGNVLIKLEGHGREDIGTDTDITRTVGWFTTTYPVVFDMSHKDNIIRQLVAIKESLHSVPNKGIGYGILRYLGGKPYVLDPQISFNYLGDFGSGVETAQGDKIFEFSGEYHGKGCPDDMPREAALEVTGMVMKNKMGVSIRYSTQQYDAVTIEALMTAYQQRMETLIMLLSEGEEMGKPVSIPASYNQQFYVAPWEVKSRVVVSTYEYEHLDIPAFNTAIQQLITRHEILRTVFVKSNGSLQQQILPAETLKFETIECISLKSENEWQAIIDNAPFSKFDLDTFPLIRVNIYKPEEGNYHVLFILHHIITDGYSKGLMQKEFMQLFNENLQGKGSTLKPLDFHYRDFTNWQHNFLSSQQGRKLKRYWLTKLDGFKPVLKFSSSRNQLTGNDLSIRTTCVLHGALYQRLNEYAQRNNLTRSAVLMGALMLLLNKMTGENDITVGTAVSGRDSRHFGELDISRSIGYFVNILLVRNCIDQEMPVTGYLQQVQQQFLEDLNYGDYPFTKLVEELPGLNISRRFLDDIVFYNYHNYDHYKNAMYHISEAVEDTVPTQCNFGLTVTEFNNCFRLELMFNPHLFDVAQRNEIQEHYFSILEQIVHIPRLITANITANIDRCRKGCSMCKACTQRKKEEVSNHFIL